MPESLNAKQLKRTGSSTHLQRMKAFPAHLQTLAVSKRIVGLEGELVTVQQQQQQQQQDWKEAGPSTESEKAQMKSVLQASIVALADPLRCLVTEMPQ